MGPGISIDYYVDYVQKYFIFWRVNQSSLATWQKEFGELTKIIKRLDQSNFGELFVWVLSARRARTGSRKTIFKSISIISFPNSLCAVNAPYNLASCGHAHDRILVWTYFGLSVEYFKRASVQPFSRVNVRACNEDL